jgi:hypothetical protein
MPATKAMKTMDASQIMKAMKKMKAMKTMKASQTMKAMKKMKAMKAMKAMKTMKAMKAMKTMKAMKAMKVIQAGMSPTTFAVVPIPEITMGELMDEMTVLNSGHRSQQLYEEFRAKTLDAVIRERA